MLEGALFVGAALELDETGTVWKVLWLELLPGIGLTPTMTEDELEDAGAEEEDAAEDVAGAEEEAEDDDEEAEQERS